MALTLDATLDAAMDNKVRRPIMSLISSEWGDDIPFTGNVFESSTPIEQHPDMVFHSNGAFYCVYREWDEGETAEKEGRHLRLYYTDTDRTTWQEADLHSFSDVSSDHFKEATIVEMPNGNLGVIATWIDWSTQNIILSRMVIDEDANVVTSLTQVDNLGNDSVVDVGGMDVIHTEGDEYVLGMAFSGEAYTTQVRKYKSGDFSSWSSGEQVGIGNIDDNVYNVSLVELSNDDVYMWMDHVDDRDDTGVELKNVYFTKSTDGGDSFAGSATQVTSYDTFGDAAVHPQAVQKVANQLHLMYTKDSSILDYGPDMAGWADYAGPFCPGAFNPWRVKYDSVNEKLYVVERHGGTGSKHICGITIVDVPTWTVDKFYTARSVPSYTDKLESLLNVEENGIHIDPPYVAIICEDLIMVLNHSTETITHYYFEDSVTYGYDRNVDAYKGNGINSNYDISAVYVDADSNRVYVLWVSDYVWWGSLMWGYIDLTAPIDPGTGLYAWHNVSGDHSCSSYVASGDHSFKVYPNDDLVIAANEGWHVNYYGHLTIWQLSTGAQHKHYTQDGYALFPYMGAHDFVYNSDDGCIYFGIPYYGAGLDVDRRGLCKLNWNSDAITFHRPSFATIDEYWLFPQKVLDDDSNEILCISMDGTEGGVIIYNMVEDSWTRWNNGNVPGWEGCPGAWCSNEVWFADIDEATGTMYTGRGENPPYPTFGHAFSRYGLFKQPYYMIGTYTTSWSWTDPALLVSGLYNGQLAPALDPDTSIWAVWRNGFSSDGGYALNWDREGEILDLSALVPNDSEVSMEWSLDSIPTLHFQVAKAWLFDPNNFLSILAPMASKGRKITAKFGEKIWDTGTETWIDYWVNQGVWVISEVSLSYVRGADPICEITCHDRRIWWGEALVLVTPNYETDPRTILLDLLADYAGITEAGTNIPNPLDNDHTVYHQWLDQSFLDVVTEICHHFGYVPYFQLSDGKFTVLRVEDNAAVSNVYTDSTKLLEFTPDDSFSSFVNKVIVQSESHDWYEVVYPEERITSDMGTIGFWHRQKTKRYYYSDDENRRCRQPRLANVENPDENVFFMDIGGGSIDIHNEDDQGYWVDIRVDHDPNNGIGVLVGLIAGLLILAISCKECDKASEWSYGLVSGCGMCMYLITFDLTLIVSILASSSHWSFELYAQPQGQEKQSIQGVAEDEDFQRELGGMIITEKIDDPFCYTVSQCERVAEHELMLVQKQRNRVMFRKIAHLQDELADTITVIHPYTLQSLDVFIATLRRTFMKSSAEGGEGYFFDEIEGWRL